MSRRRPGAWRLLAAAGAVLVLALAACGGGSRAAGSSAGTSGGVTGDVTVFAAASLTEAFTEIGNKLEKQNPDLNVRFNFAGSSTLAEQINRGAPADVFASANTDQMRKVADGGNTDGDPAVFAQNKLQIVVPKGNPGHVQGIDAFANASLDIAICAAEVPCGAASAQVFDLASVDAKPDTLEQDVKAVLTKVSLGEVDAGLVYVTDVAAARGGVEGIDFPAADKAVNDYPIVVLRNAPNVDGATAFVDYVQSDEGRAILRKYGFITEVS